MAKVLDIYALEDGRYHLMASLTGDRRVVGPWEARIRGQIDREKYAVKPRGYERRAGDGDALLEWVQRSWDTGYTQAVLRDGALADSPKTLELGRIES